MSLITVLGATGFIGRNLVKKLNEDGKTIYIPGRNEIIKDKFLGDVIYTIGLTADFRERPYDTIIAHVCKLIEIMQNNTFNSLTYLSSTRIYKGKKGEVYEEEELCVSPNREGDLYNISKLTGEALLFASGLNVKIVRLSNVYGYHDKAENFLHSIIDDAITKKHIVLNTSLMSSKDYISIEDVIDIIIKISTEGSKKTYNLASGYNITNKEIIEKICEKTGATYEVMEKAPTIIFPTINIDKIKEEFGFKPCNVISDIDKGLIKLEN